MTEPQTIQFTLLSPPKILRRKENSFQASLELTVQNTFTLNENGIEIKKQINTFYKSKPVGKYKAEIRDIKPLTNEIAETYLKFQSIIGHCIINGETVNKQLRDILISIQELNYTKEGILKMEFMSLRDVFSEFLDKFTEIHNEPNFNSKAQRKSLTKLMYILITDRNIYTHGSLRIQRPENIFVIDYIENRKELVRVGITIEF